MSQVKQIVVIVIAAFFASTIHCQLEGDPFCTKTSYLNVVSDKDVDMLELETCQPVVLWVLARHGTRNPTDGDIIAFSTDLVELRDRMVMAWEEGKGGLTEEDIEKLLAWSFDITLADEAMLTRTGEVEHMMMGSRWRSRLGMTDDLDIQVRSSEKQRSIDSGKSFLDGFLHEGETRPEIQIDNHLLRFYDDCPKWITEVDENEEAFAEKREFEASEDFLLMVDRVKSKAGVEMDGYLVELAWDMCRFERAWGSFNESKTTYSVWCSLFTMEDLFIEEFGEDLKYFYKVGPGFEVNSLMTQPLFDDLLTSLQFHEMESNNATGSPIVILNFAHSETVQPMMAALGLNQDGKPLLASDWGTNSQDHLWSTSTIAPFAANLGVVLYNCGEVGGMMVSLFQNEQVVAQQPACGAYICSLEQFTAKYQYLANLDFNSVCSL